MGVDMKKQHRFSIWYAIIGMWVVLFLHNMIAGSLTVKNIPYSEFVKAVKEGRVSEIAISENEIQGRMLGSEDGESIEHAFQDGQGGSGNFTIDG
jgi:cell division protease FtsH